MKHNYSMCIGIYEIATNTTFEGTLDDLIKEENSPGTKLNYYWIIIPAAAALAIAVFAWLILR